MNHPTTLDAALLVGVLAVRAGAAPLATVEVAPAAGDRTYAAEAVVEAVRQSAVAAQVPARILEVKVRAGDTVKAGQVLVRLDPRTAADQLASSKAQVAAADAQLEAARREYERNRRLAEKRYISQAAMDQAETQYRAAEAQAKASIAQAGVASTQTTFTTLVAPYAGVVASVNAEVGDLASPGVPLLGVYDPTELRVVAQVPESYASHIAVDRPVRITVPGGGGEVRTLEATRTLLLPTVNPATHTREARLALPAAAPGLVPGMFARAYFPLTLAAASRIAVPATAVVRRPEFTAVYVVDASGRAQLRQVRLGRVSGDRVEVFSGLVAGDRIAADPVAAARQ